MRKTGESGEQENLASGSPSNVAYSTASGVTVIPDPDDPDMVIIRTRKRQRTGRKHARKSRLNPKARVALIVVAVIVGLLAAAGIALAIAVHVGNVNLHQVVPSAFGDTETLPSQTSVQNEGQIVEYKGHTYKYNENVVSFLLIGHDDESSFATRPDASCADIDALFTLDTSTNKVKVIVVPRNSWVPVDLYDSNGNYVVTRNLQLTLSHAVLLPTIAQCAANTTKSVSRVFYNLPITYYVDIDQDVVKDATRAVGGVQVEALETIPGAGYEAGETVLLEGDSAMKYVQYRNIDVFESALDRQARQVQFVKAFANKLSNLNPQGIINLYNSVSSGVTTNLGAPEIAYLASCFVAGDNSQLEVSSLTGRTEVAVESDGIEYERYYLDNESVMENTLAAFYTQVD